MATMVSKTAHHVVSSFSSKGYSSLARNNNPHGLFLCSLKIRACHSINSNNNDIYKQVGLFQNAVFFCVRASTSGFAFCFHLFITQSCYVHFGSTQILIVGVKSVLLLEKYVLLYLTY